MDASPIFFGRRFLQARGGGRTCLSFVTVIK